MKYAIDDPRAILVVVGILALGFFATRSEWATSNGLVQVSTGTGGATAGQVGLAGAGVLTQRVTGSRTGEDKRRVWVSAGQSLIVGYKVTVDRGRLRLHVEEVVP